MAGVRTFYIEPNLFVFFIVINCSNAIMKPATLYLFLLFTVQVNIFAQNAMNISMVGHWHDSSIVPVPLTIPQYYSEVWGFEQGGREYGVIGSVEGTYILDLFDPANPAFVDYIPGKTNPVIHRDYHDYGGYLYIAADDGPNGLQVADLSFLPDSVSIVYDSDTIFDQAHNIFIDSANAVLYGISTDDNNGYYRGMTIVSLADPAEPEFIRNYSFGTGNYPHDGFVKNDTAFINLGSDGLVLMDVSNPAIPIILSNFTAYFDLIYNHSGWTYPDKPWYAFVDEWYGNEIKIIDYSDPANVNLLHTFNPSSRPDSIIPHNLMIKGDFLYLSNYQDGLRIFNISDPQNPILTGYYDTYSGTNLAQGYNGAWGIYSFLPSGLVLISDMQTGFYVFDVSPALGVSSVENLPKLEVWPLPAKDKIKVALPGLGEDQLRVQGMDGRTVLSFDLIGQNRGEVVEMIVEKLPTGVYLIELKKGNLRLGIRKIIVD